MHLDAARAQRGGDLEADEARAHDHGALRRRRPRDDRAAIGERAQRVHVRQVHARQRQPHRLGAGREQQPVVGELAAVAERRLRARRRRCRATVVFEPQVDALVGVEARRRAAAPSPPARCRPGSPWTGSADRPAARRRRSASTMLPCVALAPQHLGGREAGRAAADDHDLLRARPRPRRAWRLGAASAFSPHEHLAVAPLDASSSDGDRAPARAAPRRCAG